MDSEEESGVDYAERCQGYPFAGQRLRRDAQADSDWDLLVLLNEDKIDEQDHDDYTYPSLGIGLANESDDSPNCVFDERLAEQKRAVLFIIM